MATDAPGDERRGDLEGARPRILLLLPAHSYRLDAYVAAAARVGVSLALGTDKPAAFARAGLPVTAIDLARPGGSADAIAAELPRGGYAGVVATNESTAVIAAHVSARLGLPHNTVASVEAARDKRRMRACFEAAGVPSPRFAVLEPGDDPAAIAAIARFPCVVKPPMLTGSQGVIRADDAASLVRAVHRVRAIAARHPSPLGVLPGFHDVIVEDYLPGREVAVEAILTDGALELIAIFDKPDDLTGPYFEETLYVTPSRNSLEVQRSILDVTAAAARAMGLSHGPIHAELRVDGDHPAMVELAARSIGGLCSRVVELVAGSLEDLVLRHAAGLAPRAREASGAAGVMMMPVPKSGVLRAVRGLDRARAVPGVEGVTIAIEPGGSVRALPEGASYLGFLFARAATPAEVEAALRASFAALEIDLAPLLT